MVKKVLISIIIITITFLFIVGNVLSQSHNITKEKLEESVKKYVEKAEDTSSTYKISDSTITIGSTEGEYTINYDITNKPTFDVELKFTDGMSFEECVEEGGKSILPLIRFYISR